MSTRTVRLDDDSEEVLAELVQGTGLSASAVVKQGLLALRDRLTQKSDRSAWEVYQALDLGPGGYAIAPSTETRRGAQEAIRRKLGR